MLISSEMRSISCFPTSAQKLEFRVHKTAWFRICSSACYSQPSFNPQNEQATRLIENKSPTSTVLSLEEKWKRTTRNLLEDVSIGAFTSSTWSAAEYTLQYWLENKELEICWKLLDRLREEASASTAKSKQKPWLRTPQLLNPILKLWNEELRKHYNETESSSAHLPQNMGADRQRPTLRLPSDVVACLRDYQDCDLFHVDSASHTIVLDAVSHCQHKQSKFEGAEWADGYLRLWIESYHRDDDAFFGSKPDIVALGSVIHAWATSNYHLAAQKAEKWLDEPQIQRLGMLEDSDPIILYSSVLSAWAHEGNPFKAKQWMDRIQQEAGRRKVPVDWFSWSAILKSWANQVDKLLGNKEKHGFEGRNKLGDHIAAEKALNAAKQAELVLKDMEIQCQKYDGVCNEASLPKRQSRIVPYSIVLDTWSKLAACHDSRISAYASERAQSILDEMENSPGILPLLNNVVYNTVLTAHTRSKQPWRGERLLKRMMINLQKNTNGSVQPDTQSFSTVIRGWSWVDGVRRKDSGKRGEKILEAMKACGIYPDVHSYVSCIDCWLNTCSNLRDDSAANRQIRCHAVYRGEALLREMKDEVGIQPDSFVYGVMLQLYEKCGMLEKARELLETWLSEYKTSQNPTIKPDAIAFTPVLKAWAHSKHPQAAENAHNLLRLMVREGIQPNKYSCSAVLNAFALSKNNADVEEALEFFLEIESVSGLPPDVHAWTTLLKTFANHGRVEDAEKLLLNMIDEGRVHPNGFTYSAVLHGWSRSYAKDAPERALELLLKLKRLYEEGRIRNEPNIYSYNAVLGCMARSNRPGMAERADQLFASLMSTGNPCVKPDEVTIDNVMNAWSNEGNWERVLQIYRAIKEDERLSHLRMNAVTLRTMYSAVERTHQLSSKEKVSTREWLKEQFEAIVNPPNDTN